MKETLMKVRKSLEVLSEGKKVPRVKPGETYLACQVNIFAAYHFSLLFRKLFEFPHWPDYCQENLGQICFLSDKKKKITAGVSPACTSAAKSGESQDSRQQFPPTPPPSREGITSLR